MIKLRYTKVKTEQDVIDWYNYLVENGMDRLISDTCYGYDIAHGEDSMESIEEYGDFYQDAEGFFLIDERMYFCCKYGSDAKIEEYTDYIPLWYNSDRYNL